MHWPENPVRAYGKLSAASFEVRKLKIPPFFYTTTADLWGKYHVGPDPKAPKPILLGIARIYRGLGVSALRSVTTHGLLWTFFDLTASYIDGLPRPNQADLEPR